MNEILYKRLCEAVPAGRVLINEPMKKHTTFRIGGPADYFVIPVSWEEAELVISICKEFQTPYYIIGSPSFPRMSICLENGKTFTILAHNANEKNVYIQSARLNGKEYDKNYFTHQDIVQGGTLEFQMGPNPNPNWGASTLSLPPETMK